MYIFKWCAAILQEFGHFRIMTFGPLKCRHTQLNVCEKEELPCFLYLIQIFAQGQTCLRAGHVLTCLRAGLVSGPDLSHGWTCLRARLVSGPDLSWHFSGPDLSWHVLGLDLSWHVLGPDLSQGRTCLELQGWRCPGPEVSRGRTWFRAGLVLELLVTFSAWQTLIFWFI